MTCRHPACRQPIQRCAPGWPHHLCKGWVHSATNMHGCAHLGTDVAEPEPGTLPLVEVPTHAPDGEVA